MDLIERQAAIDAIDGLPNCYNGYSDSYDKSYIIGVLEELPSAEPRCIATIQLSQEQLDEAFEKVKADILSVKPKTGKWIGGELGECSVCGHKGCASDIWDRCKEHFCPNCGTRLEE